jgi:hypothetical protein
MRKVCSGYLDATEISTMEGRPGFDKDCDGVRCGYDGSGIDLGPVNDRAKLSLEIRIWVHALAQELDYRRLFK